MGTLHYIVLPYLPRSRLSSLVTVSPPGFPAWPNATGTKASNATVRMVAVSRKDENNFGWLKCLVGGGVDALACRLAALAA